MGILSAGLGWNTWGVSAVAGVIEPQAFAPSPWAIVAILAIYLLPHVLTGLIAGFLASFIPHRRRMGLQVGLGSGAGCWVCC